MHGNSRFVEEGLYVSFNLLFFIFSSYSWIFPLLFVFFFVFFVCFLFCFVFVFCFFVFKPALRNNITSESPSDQLRRLLNVINKVCGVKACHK